MNCPSCQHVLRDGEPFCPNCGTSIAPTANPFNTPTVHSQTLASLDARHVDDPLIGQTLDGKYQLVGRIGEGGMGTVYRARRTHIGDDVAVKVLLPRYVSDQSTLERFRREAQAAARLRHPGIVAIYDFGEARTENGLDVPAYIVMELIEGVPLRQIIREEVRLAPTRVVNLMADVCAGVGAAHRRHIVHRDLKPDNIIVLPFDEDQGRETAKVVDFGIAKLRDLADGKTLTQTGAVMGTPYYMSPEQCRGDQLDERSDVYSLGALLYEMLAGAPPFTAETLTGVVTKHLFEIPSPLPANLNIAPALEAVVMRSLAKSPDSRQQDAGKLGQELRESLSGGTLAQSGADLKPPDASESGTEFSGIAAETNRTSEARVRQTGVSAVASETSHLANAAGNLAANATRASAVGGHALVPSESELHQPRPSPAGQPATGDIVATNSSKRPLLFIIGGIAALVLSASIYFYVKRSDDVTTTPPANINQTNTGAPTQTPTNDQNPPNNVTTARTFAFARALSGHDGTVWSVAFSPQQDLVASGGADKTVRLWNPGTGAEIARLNGHEKDVNAVAFAKDGRTLASVSNDRTVRLWDVDTKKLSRSLKFNDELYLVAFAPDGHTVAVCGKDRTIKLWNTQSNETPRTLTGHADTVWSIAFSADGKTLASGGKDKTVKLWDWQTAQELATLKGHTSAVLSVAFTPDGKTLASGSDDKTIKLWNTETKTELRTLAAHREYISAIAFAKDGATLASASKDGAVKLWEVSAAAASSSADTAQPRQTLQQGDKAITSVAFAQDGSLLAGACRDGTIKLWQ